jgi:hypothetical protein
VQGDELDTIVGIGGGSGVGASDGGDEVTSGILAACNTAIAVAICVTSFHILEVNSGRTLISLREEK